MPLAAHILDLRAIVLYHPSVGDEPETPRRPRNLSWLTPTPCGKGHDATPAIQGVLWPAFVTNGLSVPNHGSLIPTSRASSRTTPTSPGHLRWISSGVWRRGREADPREAR